MNKIFYFGSAALMFAVMFTGCQSEDLSSGVNDPGRKVSMRVGLTYDNSGETRTIMNEIGGDLKCTWEKGDQIVLGDGQGNTYGYLTLVDKYAGQDFGYFESDDLRGLPEGETPVSFHYMGRNVSVSEWNGTSYVLDLSEQKGTMESLTEYDVLRSINTVTVTDGVAHCDDMELQRYMAFAHFNLTFKDGAERTNEDIIIKGAYAKLKHNLKSSATTAIVTDKEMTIKGSGNDIYVAFVPQTNVDLTVNVTINGKDYVGTLPTNTIENGKYYRQADKQGIEIAMTTDQAETVDPSKNPLLKWAESDLVRVSAGASATSKFASSPFTTGSYYQFGRNQGYTNGADAANNYTYCISSNYNSSGNVYRGLQGNTTKVTRYNATNPSNPSYFYIGYNMSGDYKSPSKTEDWETRAKANGYTYVDPLNDPEWRIPSVEDYYEILPEDENGNHGFLGTGLYDGGTAQIKTLKDGTRCAFLWSANYTPDRTGLCVEILCKVIGKDVTSVSTDDDEFWSDAEARYFKASGFIQAFYGTHYDNGMNQYLARPLDWGQYITQRNPYTEKVAYFVRKASWMTEGGFYWTSDKEQKIFCFSLNMNYNTNIQDQLAFVQISGSAACNIRMIKK